MSLSRLLLGVLLLSGVLVGLAWSRGWFEDEKAPASGAEPRQAAPDSPGDRSAGPLPAPAPASGGIEVQTPAEAGIAEEDCIHYPDGTILPPLNGVTKAPRVVFHRRMPFSPVTGKMVDANGVEWYVHENGARSTTRYQLRNGVREAVGEVMMPVAPTGVLEGR